MTELKTKKTEASVEGFLNSIADEQRRADCFTVLEMMKKATKTEPKMWGSSIVGFGSYHYKYATGHEGDCCLIGFSPRKQNLTLYLTDGLEQHQELLNQLGKHKIGKSCLYINKLVDIDLKVLKQMFQHSIAKVKKMGILSESKS